MTRVRPTPGVTSRSPRDRNVCIGVHLARLEARAALRALIALPGLRLDPRRPPQVRGLVFRKPVRLDAL